MREYIVRIEDDDSDFDEMFIGGIRKHSELIRCKDCRYYTGKWCTKLSTKQFDINDKCKDDNDYCSDAERKEE